MILKYGSYSHAQNEANVDIKKRLVENEAKQKTGFIETWIITGTLHADDQAALTIAINALKTAYAANGYNLGLYLDNGTTLTSHSLPAASAKGGTRVIEGPHFPMSTGAEYSTFRTYNIVVEAEYSIESGQQSPAFENYQESITFQGTGGPIWKLLPTLNGRWQRQQVSERSSYTVQQRGQAVGKNSRPAPAPPIWPDAEHEEQRTIEFGTPDRVGSGFENYPISWSYVFESNDQLNGNPGSWPG